MERRVERCVLFADICDSSKLYRELGDSQALELISSALSLATQCIVEQGGSVVDNIGDEIFCLLPDANAGLNAAVDIHEKISDARGKGTFPVSFAFRIGMVYGPVSLIEAQVFGDTVYLAKRISSQAKFDQTLLSAETHSKLVDSNPALFRRVGSLRLKGRVEKVELIEAMWGFDSTLDVEGLTFEGDGQEVEELRVEYQGRSWTVSHLSPVFTLGRGEHCDLVVLDNRVSRLHGRIELIQKEFVWIDLSRNGSVVHVPGRPPRSALRSNAPLKSSGTIQLGPESNSPSIAFAIREEVD